MRLVYREVYYNKEFKPRKYINSRNNMNIHWYIIGEICLSTDSISEIFIYSQASE